MAEHRYLTLVEWSGPGTLDRTAYSRDHAIGAPGKAAPIAASSDPAFRGDATRYNPEELLVASLSSCHMLWFLHLASAAGIVVTGYRDAAAGVMVEDENGGGRFERVVLRPEIDYADPAQRARGDALHTAAHAKCFIAQSVNFTVIVQPAGSSSIGSRQASHDAPIE